MFRHVTPVIVAALVVSAVAGVVIAIHRRRKAKIPELNRHPERLEQMLDETDDA